MTKNQLIHGLETYARWAAVLQGSESIRAGLRSELKEFERWSAHAIKSLEEMVKAKESEMGKAATIIASLTAAVLSLEAKLAAATTSPATSVYDAADEAAIESFLANDPTQTSAPETEPTIAAGLLLPDGTTQQAYTTFNGIQTDAANRTLYIHTGAGGFDTNAWPLAGTVAGEKVYYFALDENPGDAKGNGVANSWATIPAIAPVSPPVATPSTPAPTSPTSPASVTPASTDGTAAVASAATASTGS